MKFYSMKASSTLAVGTSHTRLMQSTQREPGVGTASEIVVVWAICWRSAVISALNACGVGWDGIGWDGVDACLTLLWRELQYAGRSHQIHVRHHITRKAMHLRRCHTSLLPVSTSA